MTKETRARVIGRRWLSIVLAAAGLAALAGCGGEERLSRDTFSDRLQSIDRQGSARYERLAEQAMRLKPDQPLTPQVKRAMRRYVGAIVRAADELDRLNPPEDAEVENAALTEALRERADAIEQAAAEERVTRRQLERRGSITRAGEKIDRAFEQLRREGYPVER